MQGVDQRRTRHSTPRALTFTSSHTRRTTTYRHPSSAPRQHSYTTFMHGGVKVCRKTFVFLHSISEKRPRAVSLRMASHHACMGTQSVYHITPQALLTHNRWRTSSRRHTPSFYQVAYLVTRDQTCSSYHRAQPSGMCGDSTATPSRLSPPLTTGCPTPHSALCGRNWFHTSW